LLPAAISVSKFSRVEASPGAIKLSKPNGTMWLGAVGHILDVLTLRSAVAAADDAASEPQLDATQPHRHLENKKATQPVSATATAAAGCDPKYAPGGCNYFPKYIPTAEETAFQKSYWKGRRDEWGSSPTGDPIDPWLARTCVVYNWKAHLKSYGVADADDGDVAAVETTPSPSASSTVLCVVRPIQNDLQDNEPLTHLPDVNDDDVMNDERFEGADHQQASGSGGPVNADDEDMLGAVYSISADESLGQTVAATIEAVVGLLPWQQILLLKEVMEISPEVADTVRALVASIRLQEDAVEPSNLSVSGEASIRLDEICEAQLGEASFRYQ